MFCASLFLKLKTVVNTYFSLVHETHNVDWNIGICGCCCRDTCPFLFVTFLLMLNQIECLISKNGFVQNRFLNKAA